MSQHRKLTLEKKILPAGTLNLQPFDHESGALPTSYSGSWVFSAPEYKLLPPLYSWKLWVKCFGLQSTVSFLCIRKLPAAATVPLTVMGEWLWYSKHGGFWLYQKIICFHHCFMGEWFWFTSHGGFSLYQKADCYHQCSFDRHGWVAWVYQAWCFFFSVPENQLEPPLFLGQSWVSVFDLPAWWVFSVPENQLLSTLFLGQSWVSVFDLPAWWVFSVPENQLLSPFTDSQGWWYTFTKHSVFSLHQKYNLCHHCSWDSHGWVALDYQAWRVFSVPENQLLPLLLQGQS